MKKRNNILKEAGVLLITLILVLTAVVIVPTMIAQTPHDVGVSNIISPFSGCLETYPVNVTVENYEDYAETFDVQVEIIKWETIMSEDFYPPSEPYLPTGWTTDHWKKSDQTNEAGGDPPEALVWKYDQLPDYYDNYIISETVDVSTYSKIKLEFNFTADICYPQYPVDFYVKWTNDSGTSWNDITPWDSITSSFGPMRFSIPIYFGPGGGGTEFQVKWEYIGFCYYYNYFYLDDVEIAKAVAEYADLAEDVTIPAHSEKVVNFSYWTPSACGEYCLTAFTMLESDGNPNNDSKTVNIIISCDFTIENIINKIDDLIDYVNNKLIYIEEKDKGKLIDKLEKAKEKIEEDPPKKDAAKDKLEGFIEKVNSDGYGLNTDDKIALTTAAGQIIWLLNYCP